MKRVLSIGSVLVVAAILAGCKSTYEDGVKSTYRSQMTPVAANTEVTTAAAKSVFEAEGLKDVVAAHTMVDGTATGKKADGTFVKAWVKKETDSTSGLTVTVGTIGDPDLGAELAKKIKIKAEMR